VSETASHDGMSEQTLRTRLAELADQAPQALGDLDRGVARAVARERRRRRTTFGAVAAGGVVFIAVAGAAAGVLDSGSAPQSESVGRPGGTDPLRCPGDLATFTLATARTGLHGTIVPGTPAEVNVCGYNPQATSPGPGVNERLSGTSSSAAIAGIVAALNASAVLSGSAAGSPAACTAMSGDPMSQWVTQKSVTKWLFRFGYSSGPEVDVVVTVSSSCESVTNGALNAALTVPVKIVVPSDFDQGHPVPGQSTPRDFTQPATVTPSPVSPSTSAG
jgi:hypothetical protein